MVFLRIRGMPKYRMTRCQDPNPLCRGCAFYAPIDLRKKYYLCHHCQKMHLVKDGVIREPKQSDLPQGNLIAFPICLDSTS